MKEKNFNVYDIEVDLFKLLTNLWKKKKFILKITVYFFIVGSFYSLTKNNLFEASSTFYPHYQDIEENSISGLASLAGINIGTNISNEVPANLYPNLIKSTPFKQKILSKKIFLNNETLTYHEYLEKNKSFDILKFIKKIITYPFSLFSGFLNKKNEISSVTNLKYLYITEEEFEYHKLLDELINIEVNEKDGYISLNVIDQNPEVSAQIAQFSEEILQQSIIDFKIKNINSLYDFSEKQLDISKNNLFLLQDSLANFKDNNIFIKSDLFLNKLNRLETEVMIAKSVYNELAINKEKTAIELKKNTPIFTIINPVTIPIERKYPKRSLITLIFGVIGFTISIFWVLILYKFKSISRLN